MVGRNEVARPEAGLVGGGMGELAQPAQPGQERVGHSHPVDALQGPASELHLVLESAAGSTIGDEWSQLFVAGGQE